MNARFLPCYVLLAALAPSASSAENRTFQTYYPGPQRSIIPLKRLPDGKLYLTVTVEGRAATLFVDTGATTILDSRFATEAGLALTETSDVATGLTGIAGRRQIAVADLAIGTMQITDQPVSCLDLTASRAVNAQSGWPELDGLIGSDLLAVLRARIDYQALTLEIRRPTAASFEQERRWQTMR